MTVLVTIGVARLSVLARRRSLDGRPPRRIRFFRERLGLGVNLRREACDLCFVIGFDLRSILLELLEVFRLLFFFGAGLGWLRRLGGGGRRLGGGRRRGARPRRGGGGRPPRGWAGARREKKRESQGGGSLPETPGPSPPPPPQFPQP